ncbi:MAG: DUF47 family protein [candidate division FCPU426 bacterium]
MLSRLFPKETQFAKHMLCFADHIEQAAERFSGFIRQFDPAHLDAWVESIKELEHACDLNTHQTMNWLESTFIVNYDREDILRLAGDLDDILDFMDAAATRISLYNFKSFIPDIIQMAEVLNQACKETAKAVRAIASPKLNRNVLEICRNIKNFEEQGDDIYHHGLASLFRGGMEPLDVIKFKEIIEEIERSLDKCNQTAMNVESLIFKYA